jgi:hypothetical protein
MNVSASILISAIAPVILVLCLGFVAGKHHSFSAQQARGFSRLALTYALPAALFLGMAHFGDSAGSVDQELLTGADVQRVAENLFGGERGYREGGRYLPAGTAA